MESFKMLRLFTLIVLSALLCVPAQAETVTKIPGKMSVTDLAGACGAAGGSFGFSADGGTYGCGKANCDGKGNDCTIVCDTGGNCSSSNPSRITGSVTILGLLQNGDNVYHSHAATSLGGASLAGGSVSGPVAAAPSGGDTIY
jgi:hypothetical protein